MMNTKVNLAGVELKNPVMTASDPAPNTVRWWI